MTYLVIDGHAHCGRQSRCPPQTFEDYLKQASGSAISGVVMFPPVMEIYDRYDPDFEDDAGWREKRRKANSYLLNLDTADFRVFPFFFIWNDFAVDQLSPVHRGIKWHRHPDEPHYRYDDARCATAIEEIRRRNLPVCLEEELPFTLDFIDRIAPGVRVIIPHCGLLNGGYESLVESGIWRRPEVFTDTALAPPHVILDYVERYGHERVFFGSDFPFGHPQGELLKILRLGLTGEVTSAIVGSTVRRLLADSDNSCGILRR
jgi:uncharacterized protein